MTRWLRAVATATLSVAVLAGCTSLVGDRAGGSGFHLAQIEGGPITPIQAIRVDRVSTPPGNEYEWTIASVDPASRLLTLSYLDGACTTADRLQVDETSKRVVIGITASKTFGGNCVASAIARRTTVTLRRPLGGRALMEGATGVNDGLPKVSDPSVLPAPTCSTNGSPSDVPIGLTDATTRLAPTAVTTAFVCRTWWPQGHARTESTTISNRVGAEALAAAIGSGSRDVRAGGPERTCPTKDARASLYDVYLQGPGLRVEVRTDGISCDSITNGAASGTMTPALERTLDALFPS